MGKETVVTTTDTTDSTTESAVEPVQKQDQNPKEGVTPEAQTTAESSKEAPVRVVPDANAYVLPEWVPKEYGEHAHKSNLTQEQLDATFKGFEDLSEKRTEAEKAAILSQGREFVKANWGESAKENLQSMNDGLKYLDSTGQMAEWLQTSGYINSPLVLSSLAKVGSMLREGGFMESSVNTPKKQSEMAHRLFPNDVPK